MGQESCNQLSTRYSVVEVPSFSSILEDVTQHVPAVCLAKPLYRRMHLQIEEAYVYCMSLDSFLFYIVLWIILLNLVHTGNLQCLAIFHNLAVNDHVFCLKLVKYQ